MSIENLEETENPRSTANDEDMVSLEEITLNDTPSANNQAPNINININMTTTTTNDTNANYYAEESWEDSQTQKEPNNEVTLGSLEESQQPTTNTQTSQPKASIDEAGEDTDKH